MPEEPKAQDFDTDTEDLIAKKWDYKQLVFWSINNFQRNFNIQTAAGEDAAKINNLFLGVDGLYILVSPCIDPERRKLAEAAYALYNENEDNLTARFNAHNLSEASYGFQLLSARSRYVRTVYLLIVDSLQAQGLLFRKEASISVGTSRPMSKKNKK
jgi:hypothetical protein